MVKKQINYLFSVSNWILLNNCQKWETPSKTPRLVPWISCATTIKWGNRTMVWYWLTNLGRIIFSSRSSISQIKLNMRSNWTSIGCWKRDSLTRICCLWSEWQADSSTTSAPIPTKSMFYTNTQRSPLKNKYWPEVGKTNFFRSASFGVFCSLAPMLLEKSNQL